jgi:hypothetical protein
MASQPSGASSTNRARMSSVRRIRQGAPGVNHPRIPAPTPRPAPTGPAIGHCRRSSRPATARRDEPAGAAQPGQHHLRPRRVERNQTCGLTTAFISPPPPNSATSTPAPRRSRRCMSSIEPAPCSASKPSLATPECRAPGSTPKPTSKTRSADSAAEANTNSERRYPPNNAPAMTPCANVLNWPTAATANSLTRTNGCAANSPTPSANSATTGDCRPAEPTIAIR